jgi:hypothetical protein
LDLSLLLAGLKMLPESDQWLEEQEAEERLQSVDKGSLSASLKTLC